MERNFGTRSGRPVAPQPAGYRGVLDADAAGEQPALQFRGGASFLAQGEQFALVSVEARAAVAGTAAGAGLGPQKGGLGGRVEGVFGGGFRVHRGMMYTGTALLSKHRVLSLC